MDGSQQLVFLLLAVDAGLTFTLVKRLEQKNAFVYDEFTGEKRPPREIEASPLARFFWRKLGLGKGTAAAFLAAAAIIFATTNYVFPQAWFAFTLAGFQLSAIAVQVRQLARLRV